MCVPINVLLQGQDVNYVVEDCDPVALIVDEIARKAVSEISAPPETVISVEDVSVGFDALGYEDLISGQPDFGEGLLGEGTDSEDPAMMYYTSGTTGRPKGTVHSHQGIVSNTYHQIFDLDLSPDDTYLVVPSLSCSAGFHDIMLPLMWHGGRSVLMPTGGLTVDTIVEHIVEERVTRTLLVPTILRQLLDRHELLDALRNSELNWIMSGSGPVPAAITNAVNEELPDCQVVQAYGQTEFPLISAILSPEDAIEHAGKAGRATSVCSLAVRHPDGTISDRGGDGEILVRSHATMVGYYNLPEENEKVFADGWLHTGDTGTLDDEGYLTVTGRMKDMLISGDMNIYPREIEDAIYTLPAVAETAVVGVPDERWGETPVAIVVPAEGASITEEGVFEICREKLSSFKRPSYVLIRDSSLPRTVTNKVLKRELRPWASSELGLEEEPS